MDRPLEIPPALSGSSSENSSPPPIERGGLANLFGVIFQPQAAFRSIGAKPSWLLPLSACMILSLVAVTLMINRMGIANMMRTTLQGNPQAEGIAESGFVKTMMYVNPLIFLPIMLLAMAGVFLLALMLVGVEVSFKQAFSIVTHSFFAYSVITTALTLVTVYATKDFSNFDLRNATATNVGFFVDPAETSKFLYSLASSLDVLSLWFLYLLAVGFAETARKTRLQKTLPAVIGVWLIYVFGKAAFSGLTGR
ncbi:MAG TPA: YIP1 family protein [Terriglobia bacterium]|nr:YIP1 family protein [Terriglobia bacterium]